MVTIAHRKPLALLAYLGVTQRVQSREVLATLLWPEHEAPRAYAYLRNALWQLGHTPLGSWVIAEQDTISLDDTVWVDASEMDRHLAAARAHTHSPDALCADCIAHLTEVISLYQGDFLAGFSLPDSPDFEEWQFFQAEHLRQEAAGALERLTRHHGAHGSIDMALSAARRWSSLDPLNEPAQRALMTLYAQAGQRATAIHQYDALLRNLKSARLEPAPETVATYRKVRSGEIEDVTTPVASDVVIAVAEPQPRHNLPVQATTFIGRDAELAELYDLLVLPECRLITLTGPGGIGKTRLALKAAQEQVQAFPDGVAFVPLAAAADLSALISAIVEALGTFLYPQNAVVPQEQLLIYLSGRRMLLLLDNLEHLLEHSGLLADILARAPGVKLLATSRERLNLRGEWVLDLRGLPYEAEGDQHSKASDAATLFVETAQRINASFAPDAVESAAITRICMLVSGMPLGIELAAAWTKMLSCTEIAGEIETSLDFLTLTLRDLPERHQSLRAVFARSWGLLSEDERRHFRALAVFRAGFTREAAQAVADSSLPALLALMDKSLLRRGVEQDPTSVRTSSGRYDILEVLRQYAEEQLHAIPGELETVRDRHAVYYLDLVHRTEALLKGPLLPPNPTEQRIALDTLQWDIDNIRRAWDWAADTGMFEDIARAALGLAIFCEMRSRFREGEALFRRAADALQASAPDQPPPLLGLLRGIQGQFMTRYGYIVEGCALMEQARVLLTPAADAAWLALMNVITSYIDVGLGVEARKRRMEESLRAYHASGDGWGIALTQEVLGELLVAVGEADAAEKVLVDSLAYRRRVGDDWGAAMTLHTMATASAIQGRGAEVMARLSESKRLREGIGDVRGVVIVQELQARWMASQGDPTQALELYARSLRGYQDIGDLSGVAHVLSLMGILRRALGDLPGALTTMLSALEQYRVLGQDRARAEALQQLGQIAMQLDAHPQARGYLSESLAILEALGDDQAAAAVREDLSRLEELE
ncbi:MAG: tetratricopeptide repeat protein [Anaerolineae bacterium]|nr:tetratricopeptide repeat protein [Anaerolineae bacterium]